jgi:hypothetical protein
MQDVLVLAGQLVPRSSGLAATDLCSRFWLRVDYCKPEVALGRRGCPEAGLWEVSIPVR